MKFVYGLVACAMFVGTALAQQELAPDALVKNVTGEVLSIVGKDQDIQNGNTAKAIALVEAKILPDFDFQRMTSLAMGKEWRKATPGQQSVLTSEFRTLLVRTYSRALTNYKDQTIAYKPTRMAVDENDATVRSEVRQPGAKPVAIDYAMEKIDAAWKVYDITVSGISLVMSYRDQFSQEIASGGVEGLIKVLHAKNQNAASNT